MSVTRHIHTHINECDKSVDRPQAMQEYSPDLGLAVYFDFLIGIPTKVAQIQIVYGFYEVSVRIWLALFRFCTSLSLSFAFFRCLALPRAHALAHSFSLTLVPFVLCSVYSHSYSSLSFLLSLSLSLSLLFSVSFSLSVFLSLSLPLCTYIHKYII